MKSLRKLYYLILIAAMVLCTVIAVSADDGTHTVVLANRTAYLDGVPVPEYDYVWNADPGTVHDELKDAPAEYYTGTKPSGNDMVYAAHDIFYFPEVPADKFERVFYDDDMEWVYYYPAGEYSRYIWATLPVLGDSVPTSMMHSEGEAWSNPVLHITKPGTYELTGTWKGQIWIDLGDQDATFTDGNAKVTLILNNVDVTCTVAPALVFYSVYEADNGWESRGSYGPNVDISNAGARVVIADDSVNTFNGTNVSRMLKVKYKDDNSTAEVKPQKKLRKLDGAFYSFQSMLIEGQEKGNGVLNVIAAYEGLGTELHLTLNSGKVNIQSQDDGVNVNEDDVSVVTVNGGELHIVAGLGAEGDGLDSNGYLVINGGTVISAAKPISDSGLDSSKGSYVNGGYVVATGSTMDWAESDSGQVTMNLQFAMDQEPDEAIVVTNTSGKVLFAYDPDKDETTGANNRGYRGAVISSPEFRVGETYYVYIGGDVTGTETDGLYDITTVTGFSGGKRQVYAGTEIAGPGGRRDDGEDFPDDMPDDPMSMFQNVEGFSVVQEKVSITEAAANEILSMVKQRNPQLTVTVAELMATTDMRDFFDLLSGGMGGPGGDMGGPGGGMGGPGSGMGGPGGSSGSNNDIETSAEFRMEDMVNAFAGVADDPNS